MADTAASTQSRTTRASSTKRRANTVSAETENKLARAARSAQRLAQLSDASRDDATLDLFPDDPTRATLDAMNIDIRQGTLHGFELPDVVLAAVGAAPGVAAAAASSFDTRAARRASREKAEPAYASVPLDGFERVEPMQKVSEAKNKAADAAGLTAAVVEGADGVEAAGNGGLPTALPVIPAIPATVSPSMAAASLVRSVTARRQGAEPSRDVPALNAAVEPADGAPQRLPESDAAASASAIASDEATAAATTAATSATTSAASNGDDASRPIAPSALPYHDATPTAPELDRARATAFADTVDALYGVISDQRRAATDHSRRVKWMLSIVVGALLVTVAIGITQTVLLMRLTRETTAQQHRIEQLMQNQQAAMTSLLDAHLAAANPVPAPPLAASAPAVVPRVPAAAPAAAGKHKAHTQTHAHKPKAVLAH